MPGRYCSSARRRADRGSPPHGAVRSRTKRVAPAHRRFLSPWRVRRTGRQPHIPAVLPRTRAGRSPRHEPRSGASAGLSRVAPHITGGPRHAPRRPSSACVELGRSMCITFQVSAREILVVPRRSASEITEIPRRPCRSSSGCPLSSRDETPSDAPGRTRRAPPRAVCHRGCPPPVDGLTSSSPTRRPFPTCPARCPQGYPPWCSILWKSASSTDAPLQPRAGTTLVHSLWVELSTLIHRTPVGIHIRGMQTTTVDHRVSCGATNPDNIMVFPPKPVDGGLVHTLWTAHPKGLCAQFCGPLWTKALSVWTGHPRSVDDVWGQIGRTQAPRLSHTGPTGSSTRICAL